MSPRTGIGLPRRERLAVAAILLSVAAVIAAPYLYGLATCPPDKRFLGLVGPYGNDQAFYLGWGPRQAEAGHVLFEDKYNGHTETRLAFNSLWLAMGWAARGSGLSVLTVFQLQRVAFSLLLLLQAYAIIRRFVDGLQWRLAALLLVAFSSGFGAFGIPFADWLGRAGSYRVPAGRWTPDLWVVESNVFLIMLGELVLPLATALFLAVIRSGIGVFGEEGGSPWRTGFLTLALGTVYPYAVLSAWAILTAFAARQASRQGGANPFRAYLIVVALSCPMVVYDALLVLRDPRLTVGQALYASPDPFQYLLGFGLLSLFAPLGVLAILRRPRGEHSLLLLWMAVTSLQIYIPRSVVPFQLQLILGIQIPLAVTAVLGATALWGALGRVGRAGGLARAVAAVVLVAAVPLSFATSAYHLLNVYAGLRRQQLPEYMDRESADAIDWLGSNTQSGEVVLSAPEIAPYIPVLAHNRVYCGDYAAPTADFDAKQRHIDRMLRPGTSDAAVSAFLREARVAYVFYDSHLRRRESEGARGRLVKLPGLERVYENAGVTILRVEG